MDPADKELINSLSTKKQTMVEQLHHFCQINSGTTNLSGLTIMHQELSKAFQPIASQIETLIMPEINTITMSGDITSQHLGNALFVRKRPELKRRVLLAGHMDTVYDAHSPFQKLTYLNENTLNGPGVSDMKGGLIVLMQALFAFENTPEADTLGWDVFINADEEIGSPASAELLAKLSNNYQAALVYEPALDSKGTLAKNRGGSGKFTLIATGKAAHVGRAFAKGRNAITYLAEAIIAIHALNGLREGVTINIGKVGGGEALNMVPDKAVAKLDVRISKPEDKLWVNEQFSAILSSLDRPDYSLILEGDFARPVKPVHTTTKILYQNIQQTGKLLNLAINWENSGGCCDGNNLAQNGLAVIDTLGVRGGSIHSSQEFILLDSLVERATLSALLLRNLAQGGLEALRV